MPKTFSGSVKFPSNFDVQTTRPLDVRLVVDTFEDLTNGSIEAPYQGMVVNIKGTSELWILKESPTGKIIEDSKDPNNWELVTGSGNGLSKYSLPVMTPEMVTQAEADEDIEFDGSEDPYILIENDFQPTQAQGDVYLSLIHDMAGAIRALQAEVARLRNSFDYGIDSYNDTRTAKGTVLGELEAVEESEPLWAIDPGYLSLVPDNTNFNTILDQHNTFIKLGSGDIDVSVEGQLTFNNCSGVFYDGKRVGDTLTFEDPTLYALKDSKLITYLVTDKPDIKMTLVSIDDKAREREINFAPLLKGNTVNKYGFCVVISRKVKNDDNTEKGFNYIYFSIINYETDKKLFEGYLTNNGLLVDTRVDLVERFSIKSIQFDNLTLSRMKFYTKFEDFSEEVISSAPSEQDYKYEVAHIAIRSVQNKSVLETVKDHLRDNELIWNKEDGTLHIKSDGKIYLIGSNNEDDKQNDDNMTDKQIVDALKKMGIIVNVECDNKTGEILSLSNISLSPISDITFINNETNKKFTFTVDTEGNLVGKDNSAQTIAEFMESIGSDAGDYDTLTDYVAVRGFICDYLTRRSGKYKLTDGVNKTGDTGKNSDRLRISSFYAPITTDETHGCTHSFIELENSSDKDIPLTGIYLHFFNPSENDYTGGVHHLELDGVIKAGSTYLIRGAKHAEFDDESAFIKVKTFDKEWYENGQPLSFEQESVKIKPGTTDNMSEDSPIKKAYRFCLTYGLADLTADTKLVERSTANRGDYDKATYPNMILNPRFIDSCSFSTLDEVSKQTGNDNPWYINGNANGLGITIKPNSMFRLMFALDPAKQAFNGFNTKDSSRVRYNSANDIQILRLDKEFIGYPFSNEIINIDRYTPRASFENRNVMTDKSQLDREKPNMVTCSFGVDVYNTRCFNWISCGVFDEYVWIRKQCETTWTSFQSYTKVSSAVSESTSSIHRKEYSVDVNNTVYARMINRFPGNDVLFTAHKCVVVLPDATNETGPVVYEYVVGRPDKDGKPDTEHTNDIFTFTVYPRDYEGRVYQVTDQQGFHWIEYQVWAASAEYLNTKIADECAAINADSSNTKVFPILINTGDMTQSGARINEWLDYYNGGISLFNHLEQMNCVGNNDLCPINPRDLGTGNDADKSSSHFFHYFYCFDVKDTEKYDLVAEEDKKFFSGETLIVKAHTGSAIDGNSTVNINVKEDKYIPSLYYFKTKDVLYIVVNSEIPISNCQKWFGLCSSNNQYVNIYTGIEAIANGEYANTNYFTPVYETMYAWLKSNQNDSNNRKVIVAMHEMPFTVITRASLVNDDQAQLPCTRNHPTALGRLGSNVNQLNINENRGIYWCSRLLEFFNCKLVIGGHKHTYALSYPIKEKYSWIYTGEDEVVGIERNHEYDSKDLIKPMLADLSDEGGLTPKYEIIWDIDLSSSEVKSSYNIKASVPGTVKLNSTKTPYIPEHLYKNYGEGVSSTDDFRCCTPLDLIDSSDSDAEYEGKYDGFVTYSMCQATGYKLKSNKELPSKTQVFSKIIPETKYDGTSDKPSGEQLFPMYAILEFNNDCSELDVTMNRICGIFATEKKDTFNQIDFGKDPSKVKTQMLCTYEKEDCKDWGTKAKRDAITGDNIGDWKDDDLYYNTDDDRIYKFKVTEGEVSWTWVNNRVYGKWLNESVAKERARKFIEQDPVGSADNRYLHIIF